MVFTKPNIKSTPKKSQKRASPPKKKSSPIKQPHKITPEELFILENRITIRKAIIQSISQYRNKTHSVANIEWVKDLREALEDLDKIKKKIKNT